MERNIILNALTETLNPNPQIRKAAEEQLGQFETQPGFTVFCLELTTDQSVPPAQRSSAAVFFKNRVYTYWGLKQAKGIVAEEQDQIRGKLIESLIKARHDNHIRPQLQVAVKHILNRGDWNLDSVISHLLNSTDQPDHLYTGLILLLEVTKCLRYKYTDDERAPLNMCVDQSFPLLEKMAAQLINMTDYDSGEMLYYILKIFKYVTLVALPRYLQHIPNLQNWIYLHLTCTQKSLPQEVLDLDPMDRVLDKRVKCHKWGFGNLQRFYSRYCTPSSKQSSPEFIEFFNKTYVPQILQVYFSIVEKWGTGTWLSDPALYNLISFFEKCIITDAWQLIQPHYNAILRHLLFPCLCQKDLELFEDDPEDYIRRFFDINRESNTADVAAVDALFVTAHHRFEEVNGMISLLNDVFNNFSQNPSEENALKAEGGLRVISSISFSLTKAESPFASQIDQMIDGFIVPLLTGQYEFLRARACETISIVAHTYTDKDVLARVYQGVYENFKNDTCLPIQIEAADALKVLITDELVMDVIKADVPHIMQKLLTLSKSFELDMLAEIMEAFVEVFADELQPFAVDMGKSLCEQFIRTATEMMEMQNAGSTDSSEDKEYQAIGFINTMSTMTYSMSKVNLEEVLLPAVEFVVQNGAIAFITEAMELLESLVTSAKTVSPPVWAIYNTVIESFETCAPEFFETYIPFFEAIIMYGFKGQSPQAAPVVAMKKLLHELIDAPYDYDNVGAFELVEYMVLMFGEFSEDLPLIIQTFDKEELAPHSVVRVLLASMYVDPQRTLQVTESLNCTIRLFETWFNLSTSFETVYGLKLQILALLSLFSLPALPDHLAGFLQQFANKLVICIERLPHAITKRSEQLKLDYVSPEGDEENYEAEEDVFKTTPLDDLNAFADFAGKVRGLQTNMPERYQQLIGSLSEERQAVVENVLKFVEEQAGHQ